MPEAYDVCVLGGGPAGLAAAIAMSQAGWRVAVLERARPPIDKACGEGLLPDGLDALRRLGISLPPGLGFRFAGIRFVDQHARVDARFPSGPAVGLRRTNLHTVLAERAEASGARLCWDLKSVSLKGQTVTTAAGTFKAELIVAADGLNSITRREAGLDPTVYSRARFGFRQHFAVRPPSDYVEVHWHDRCQVYVTPLGSQHTAIAVLTNDPALRVGAAIELFPDIARRLRHVRPLSREMGGLSVQRRFRRIVRPGLVLCGDASGSVDAITGEGIGLAFRQALLLASAGPEQYAREHAKLCRRTRAMSRLLLLLSDHPALRRRVLRGLASHPEAFASLLAVHSGEADLSNIFSWSLLQTCCAIFSGAGH